MKMPPPYCQTTKERQQKRASHRGDGVGMVARLVASCGTHVSRCVRVDLARLEGHCATTDEDATTGLPNHGGTSVKASTPSGRWGGFMMASAYAGLVVVDIATVERDCASVDVDATSGLPNNKARQ